MTPNPLKTCKPTPNPKEKPMSDLTDEQRARALEMWRAATRADGVSDYELPGTINEGHARYWLAAEAHVLASHTCQPVWRPTTRDEIQVGWEIRARRGNGSEASWGVAHHQNHHGNWFTKSDALLTYDAAGWTYETTAPLPEPEPDLRVGLLEGVCLREGVVLTRSDAALLLSIADAAAPNSP